MGESSRLDVPLFCHASYFALRESCHIMQVSRCVKGATYSREIVVDDENGVAQTEVAYC